MVFAIAPEPTLLKTDPSGVVRVAGTRVTLDTLVAAFLEQGDVAEIQQQYPVLELADIYSVIGYYLRHKTEVEAYIADRQREAAAIRQAAEQTFNPIGIRDRLLARRKP